MIVSAPRTKGCTNSGLSLQPYPTYGNLLIADINRVVSGRRRQELHVSALLIIGTLSWLLLRQQTRVLQQFLMNHDSNITEGTFDFSYHPVKNVIFS